MKSAYEKIHRHVESLFEGAPRTSRAIELKDELISNLMDKFSDLVQQGETEEAALGIVIAGIGDLDELIRDLREQEAWDPLAAQYQRQRSAMLVAIGVALIVASLIFPIICSFLAGAFGSFLFMALGYALMMLCIAAGVGFLVYNAKSSPKTAERKDVLRDKPRFKPEKDASQYQSAVSPAMQNTIQAIIYTATVPLYLIMGLFFNLWHPGWIIFPLAPVAGQLARLLFQYRQEM